MKITLITGPTVEPITLAEARLHLRLDTDGSPATHPDDDLVTGLITAARQHAESFTRRVLVTQTWDYWLDRFPAGDSIELPKPPLQSVTSLTYTDTAGAESSLTEGTEFSVDSDSLFGRVVLDYDETWPTDNLRTNNPIKIRFVAGYDATTDSPPDYRANVPKAIKTAMLLMIGNWYNFREAAIAGVSISTVPMGVDSLLYPYRALTF